MIKGLYILNEQSYEKIYSDKVRQEIGRLVDVYAPAQTAKSVLENPSILYDAEVIFSGWGAPMMDEKFLKAASKLKAVFYGAGSIKSFVTGDFWGKNIIITSAYAANAVPVSEFTLSQILYCLKRGWYFSSFIKQNSCYPERVPVPGAYGSTVGIISLGMIGQLVCKLLKAFDVKIIAYDPYIPSVIASELGIELCTLNDIFTRSDVVSLHTPWIKETENMIRGSHFRLMKTGAAFINTARGAVVCEPEMIEALRVRTDLQAILDVTYPEPPVAGSPLYAMDNVTLTPHIAGSMGNECQRMGEYMLQELNRYLKGEPLKWALTQEKAAHMA